MRRIHFVALSSVSCLTILLAARVAEAAVSFGGQLGVGRSDDTSNPSLGYAFGIHAELDVIPTLKLGPYFYHAGVSAFGVLDNWANTFGLRGRFVLPVSGRWKPYAFVGAGYTFAGYVAPGHIVCDGNQCGLPYWTRQFIDIPMGIGIAYELSDSFQLLFDVAYRPGVPVGGDMSPKAVGMSMLLGVAFAPW